MVERKRSPKTSRLRELLATRTLAIPGAFNALVAMQIERAGYEIAYVSGAAISACRGMPDIGLLTLSDMASEAGRIARSVSIPTIVDADTGYGGTLSIAEAVWAFEESELAGMQIEDQETAKKCGHLSGKSLVPVEEMTAKIKAAVHAKRDPDFMIIARTDARSVEGLEAAVQRAAAYAAAGADALFPEALESAVEFRTFVRELTERGITVPLIANMTEFGKTPLLSVAEFERLGYRGVLFPVTGLRTALQAVERLLAELKLFGSQKDWLHRMMTRRELYSLLQYTDAGEHREGGRMSIAMKGSLVDEVKGRPAYSPGLEGVIAGESALCLVDEGEAGLLYRGYPIRDLAEDGTFEEVAYLLLFGHLPNRLELADFSAQLIHHAVLPHFLEVFLDAVPSDSHPMDMVRTGVSLLGMVDPDAADNSHEANVRKSVRLLAQIPLMIATSYRFVSGKPLVRPQEDLTFAENLLYLLTDRRGSDEAKAMAHVLDVSLTLYAEHEFNASTFAARVTASTMTDLHSAVTSAIGTLKGPLHGGANEAVAEMFLGIGSREQAEAWVREALRQKQRIMGFGHRVLKKGDSRSAIIQRHAESLSWICGDRRWYEIATAVDQVMEQEKGLRPNLDFYTAVAYLLMEIPRTLYTPVFICSRITGWCAHVIEQQDRNRLMRPRALYTGPPKREYVPLDRRT